MPIQFLSDSQRSCYGRYVGTPSQQDLARCFHLDEADRDRVGSRRGSHNRLGYALQLGSARYLGTFVPDLREVPETVVTYVAGQLGAGDPNACQRLYHSAETRQGHCRSIMRAYGYARFSDQPGHFALVRWLFTRAWLTGERPTALFDDATRRLIDRRVLLPSANVLERLVARTRSRANSRLWRVLAGACDADQATALEGLLEVGDDGLSTLDRLGHAPRRLSSPELVRALDRLVELRSLGVGNLDLSTVPARRLRMLARYGMAAKAQAIARMPRDRRIATLLAVVRETEMAALDDALDVFDMLIGKMSNQARHEGQRERLRTLRLLDDAALTLAQACYALLACEAGETDVLDAVFAEVPKHHISQAVEVVSTVSRHQGCEHYDVLLRRNRTVRRFLPRFLDTVRCRAIEPGQPVLEAVEFLRSIEGSRRPEMSRAPLQVVTRRWRPYVVRDDGKVDRRAYTFCVLGQLRDCLRRRDVYVSPSQRWGDPRAKLLGGAAWAAARSSVCRDLGTPADPDVALSRLSRQLDSAYRNTAKNVPSNAALRIEAMNGHAKPVLSPLERLPLPPSLTELRSRVARLMPQVDLPELMLEVEAWTGFSDEFAHMGDDSARIDHLETSVCAVLMAEACNIGLKPIARPDAPALRHERLSWVRQHYFRADTIARANARLVQAQSSIPLARAWGGGEVASADGLRFVVPVRTINAGPNPKYFRGGRGVTYYNLVSDHYSGLHAVVVPGTLRDSLYILDGLLEHETCLNPTELMADTAGYSDVVFGLFWLLGFQFSPRLADLGHLRFWRMDPAAHYGPLDPLARHTIRPRLIAQHWEELLRVAGSLHLGKLRASELMRTLQRGGRTSALSRAIAEVGRIAKTLHLLAYIDDESYRRRIQTQLNRGESRHAVARAVFFGKRGEIRKAYREGQEDQLSALGLVVNMIVLWNTMYTHRALEHLRKRRQSCLAEDVARLSPLTHEHINTLGSYRFALPEPVAAGRFRSLDDGG